MYLKINSPQYHLQGQPPLFDSTRIQPTLHPMQLSVLPIDMNRGINPTNQTQQIIMPSVPIRSTALRSDTLIGDLSIMSDVITNTQKYDCLLRKKRPAGIEPTTSRSAIECSTTEL